MIKFSSYQDTNTPWIGEIPTGWSLKSLKHIFTEKKSTKNPDLGCGSISFGKVIYKDDEKIPESTKESYQEVLDGEFLINPLNLNYDLKSLRIGLSRINVVVSQGYIVLNIKDGFAPEYYEYLLRKFDVEHMKSLGQGVRQTISYTHIKDEKLVVPPVEEQNRISRYLNKKTSQIDSLINKTEKKIELLKEQRTSLINQYVTKGLDPNVEMKHSGVEWIGEIPKHWEFRKLKHFFSYKKGAFGQQLTTTFLSDNAGEYPVYSGQTENFGILGKWDSHEFDFKSGVIFCTTVGAKLMTTRVISGKFSLSQNCLILIPKNESINSEFINYFFDFDFKIRRELLPTILQPSLRMEDLDQYLIPVPPISEQMSIINKLNSILNTSDQVTNNLIKKISLLKEYRQSLISSAVTGKVRITEELI
jgi:type I restriction enzyme S subunit